MIFSFITSFLLANSLKLGSSAPQIEVLTDEGITLDLGEALSAGTTLVFFYPKAMRLLFMIHFIETLSQKVNLQITPR